jgi:hypothetical protein
MIYLLNCVDFVRIDSSTQPTESIAEQSATKEKRTEKR